MAFVKRPSTWVAEMIEDGTYLKIKLDDADGLEGLTAAEADASSGDIRKIFRALCDMMQTAWVAQNVADLPARMKIGVVDMPLSDGYTRKMYSFAFDLAVTAEEVVEE